MIHCLVLKYNIVIVNMMQFTLWYNAVPHQYLSGGADQSAFMNQCWLIGQSRPQTINLYDGFVSHDAVVVVAVTSD